MPPEQDQEIRSKRLEDIAKGQKYAALLGIAYWELLSLGLEKGGTISFHETEERKEKARRILGEKVFGEPKKRDSKLEVELQKYVLQSIRAPQGNLNLSEMEKTKTCLICKGEYHGAYSVCGVCGHIYRTEFMKKETVPDGKR